MTWRASFSLRDPVSISTQAPICRPGGSSRISGGRQKSVQVLPQWAPDEYLEKSYRHKRHPVSMLHAHLVVSSKYRHRVMIRRVFDVLRKSMKQTSMMIDIEILATECDGDHIHLMISCPPSAPAFRDRAAAQRGCLDNDPQDAASRSHEEALEQGILVSEPSCRLLRQSNPRGHQAPC